MNIESVRDLRKLEQGIVHKIKIFGLLDSISYENSSYIITVTKNIPGEHRFRIKLRSKEGERYLITLVKWILYQIGIYKDVYKPFQVKNIVMTSIIFIDCQCIFKCLPNNKSGIFLTDMTPLDYDSDNEAMRIIMARGNDLSNIVASFDDQSNSFNSILSTPPLPASQSLSTQPPPLDTQPPESQFDDPLFNPVRRAIPDSQSEYDSQPMLTLPPKKKIKIKREETIIEEEQRFHTPLHSIPQSSQYNVENENENDDEHERQNLTAEGYITKMSGLSQLNDYDMEFQYVGYITNITQVGVTLWRYDTVLMGDFHDMNSTQGFIEVHGSKLLKIGLYEFKCKTWSRNSQVPLVEYLIIDSNKLKYHHNEDEEEVEAENKYLAGYTNGVSLLHNSNNNSKEDEVLEFDQIDLGATGKEKYIRFVGLCVAVSREHADKNNGYKEIMLTDFTINPKERCKYFFDRYIDTWESLQLRHNQGIRVKLFNNNFEPFDQEIKKRYDGKSIFDMIRNREGNISRQRIVVDFTLRLLRYGGKLDAIAKGYKILTHLPSYIPRTFDSFSDNIAARAAKILAICDNIKSEYSQKGQNILMNRTIPDSSLDNLPTTEQFQITKVLDISLTFGGKSLSGRTPRQVEILCTGGVDNKSYPCLRLVVIGLDLFFLGNHDDDSDEMKRSYLHNVVTKIQNRTGDAIVTDLLRALPQPLYAPITSQMAEDLTLQQFLQ